MNPTEFTSCGIGACLNCRHLFLSTPTYRDCPLCGFAPKLPLLPLPETAAEAPAVGGYDPGVFPVPPGIVEALEEAGRGPTAAEEAPPTPFVWETPCPCCGRDLVFQVTEEEVTCCPKKRPAAEGEPTSGEEELLAGGAPPSIEEGAAETEEPTHAEEPAREPVSGDPPVKDDTAAPPLDDTPPGD